MSEEHYDIIKDSILNYVREVFDEMEEEMAYSHEEKYALLEDTIHSASDVDELKVAFGQWYSDHNDDLQLEYELEEMWANAVSECEDYLG